MSGSFTRRLGMLIRPPNVRPAFGRPDSPQTREPLLEVRHRKMSGSCLQKDRCVNLDPEKVAIQSLKARLTSSLVWVFTGRMTTALFTLLTTILAGRSLDLADFGRFVLLLTISIVLSTGLQFGMHQTLVREIAARPHGTDDPFAADQVVRARHLLTAGNLFLILVALASLKLGLAKMVFGSTATASWIAGLVGISVGRAYETLVGETFRGDRNPRMSAILGGNISGLLSLLVFLYSMSLGERLDTVILLNCLAVAGLLGAVAAELLYRTKYSWLRRIKNGEHGYSKVLKSSWPLAVSGVFALVLAQADIWTVARLGPTDNTAIYGAPARLVSFVSAPHALASFVVLPFIAELYSAGKKEILQRILFIAATLAAVPAFLVLGLFLLLPEFSLTLTFGPDFAAARMILTILSAGQMVNVLVGTCGLTLIMIGRPKMHMAITLGIGVAQIGILTAYYKQLGLHGIAWVSSGSMALTNISMWVAARKLSGLWTHASIVKALKAVKSAKQS